MRSPVSRRSVLVAGTAAAGLGLLSGCGVRLDTPPDVPVLDASEELRNRIARIFAATAVSDGDPETAGEDLQRFRDAIGPVWAPPTELATEPPPAEEDRSYVAAAEAVATAVFDAVRDLGSGLIPVLTDVATGCALSAGTVDAAIRDDADRALQEAFAAGDDGATASQEPPTDRPRPAESAAAEEQERWNTILDQARAASYGYERLAVHFERGSAERRAALARLESLGSLAGEMLQRLGVDEAAPDAPAWRLDPSPTDAESATQLALALEDGIVASVLPWLRREPRAALRLWESARARSLFAAPQALRFTYAEGTAEAVDGSTGAVDGSTGAGQ